MLLSLWPSPSALTFLPAPTLTPPLTLKPPPLPHPPPFFPSFVHIGFAQAKGDMAQLHRAHEEDHGRWEAERDALQSSIEVRSTLQRAFAAKAVLRYAHGRWANVHMRPALHRWRAVARRSASAAKIMRRWVRLNEQGLLKRVVQVWRRGARTRVIARRVLSGSSARSTTRTLRMRFRAWVAACREMERGELMGDLDAQRKWMEVRGRRVGEWGRPQPPHSPWTSSPPCVRLRLSPS